MKNYVISGPAAASKKQRVHSTHTHGIAIARRWGRRMMIAICFVVSVPAASLKAVDSAAGQLAAGDLTAGERAIQAAIGRTCQVVRLWPSDHIPDAAQPLGAEEAVASVSRPGDVTIRNVSQPSMTILAAPADTNTGTAIILCPGGGYGQLEVQRAVAPARWFNARGVNIVLLKYRVPKRNQGLLMYHHALQDAQRAVGVLRTRATDWGIDPDKIGVGGVGAGGHLAATVASLHAKRRYTAVDACDTTSCRPDFSLLIDPAYLTDPIRSRELTPHLRADELSTQKTPPTFTAITDPSEFTTGAIAYALALRQAKVNHELHLLGSRGARANDAAQTLDSWASACHRWLGDISLVPGSARPAPLTYQAKTLPAAEAAGPLTLGDVRIRQILGYDAPVIPVWPMGVGPDETRAAGPEKVTHRSRGGQALNITDVTRPTLTLMKAAGPVRQRRAVIVCPGGGYGALAAEHEGTRVAQWFNELGVTALLLKYRVPRRGGEFAKHHHALQDLQRAVRIARASASEWEIDPRQIGICGFSAGGHLCTTLATHAGRDSYEPIDAIDQQSSRPDFALLVYPAYLTDPVDSHNVDTAARGTLRSGVTPPLFFAVAANDRFAGGMLDYMLEVRRADVAADCHVYATGGHGGGLDPVSYPTSQWTRAAKRWLDELPTDRTDAQSQSGGGTIDR